jgi:hypothetical protein
VRVLGFVFSVLMSSGQKQSYALYLQSEHWHGLRAQALRFAKRRCESCGSRKRLECHHLVYRNPLTICAVGDIMVLCDRCHGFTHGIPDLRHLMNEAPDNLARRGIILDICSGQFRRGRWTMDRVFHQRVAKSERNIRKLDQQFQPLRPAARRPHWRPYTPNLQTRIAESNGLLVG